MAHSSFENELSALRDSATRLRGELDRLEQRIRKLESDISAAPALKTSEIETTPKPSEPLPSIPPVIAPPIKRQILEELVRAPRKPQLPAEVSSLQMPPRRESQPARAPDSSTPVGRLRDERDAEHARPRVNLETRIGGVWLNRIGAVILLFAAGFLLKLSIERGWISPTTRLLITTAFGMAIIGVGEYELRKGRRTFAGGMLGCGIGILYLVAFGAHKYYELVEHSTASVLYTMVTVLGVVIAVHARMLPVALLAMVGAYGTPLLLNTHRDQQVALLTYVLAVDIGFLLTAQLRRWDTLRPLAWFGTLLLFGGWFLTYYQPAAMWRTVGFILAFYLVFHAASLFTLFRNAIQIPRLAGALIHVNNVAFFAATYFLLRRDIPEWMGLFAVVTAGAQWLAAWRLGGKEESGAPARNALWLDGAAMLALAAPIQFDRYLVSVSWAIQSVVTLWFCRRSDEVWLRVKGAGVLAAAIAHLIKFDYFDARLTQAIFSLGSWTVSWLLLCFLFVGLCAKAGGLALIAKRAANSEDRSLAAILIIVGTVLWLGIFADQWERFLATWWWIGLAIAWWIVARRVPNAGAMMSLIVIAVLTKFLAWDTLAFAAQGHWSKVQGIFLNDMVFTGLLVSGLSALAISVSKKTTDESDELSPLENVPWLPAMFAVAAMFVVTWTGAFEIYRVCHFEPWATTHIVNPRNAASTFITAFWALQSAAMWVMMVHRRKEWMTYTLGLTSLVALKTLLADTALMALSRDWDALSGPFTNRQFLTGLLVIAVMFIGYVRLKKLSHFGNVPWLPALFAVVAVLLITWTGAFEIYRVCHFEPWAASHIIDSRNAASIFITAFWALQSAVMWVMMVHRRKEWMSYALALTSLVALKTLFLDTALMALSRDWRALSGPFTNRQFLTGLLVIGVVFVGYDRIKKLAPKIASRSKVDFVLAMLVTGLVLIPWVPTFEIIRIFSFEPVRNSFSDPNLSMHVTLSIFWSVNAIAFLIVGFLRRIAVIRYMGIALFGLTVGKVFLVDLAHLEMVYRVISFMVVGVLLMLASWLYQRLSALTGPAKDTAELP